MNENRNIRESKAEVIDRLMREIHFSLLRLSRDKLKSYNMTSPRLHVLARAMRLGPLDMGSLHHHMHISRSTLTSLVNGLVSEGLLVRYRLPEDRRRVMIGSTTEGQELVDHLHRHRCSHLEEAISSLDENSIDAAAGALEQILINLESRQEHTGGTDACSDETP
ncbi:MAG: MarR family winged helix-turn-helix transcriptional regulator [Spirochaetales bacterium]